MPKWEYLVVRSERALLNKRSLDEYGYERWELVTINYDDDCWFYTFKRSIG